MELPNEVKEVIGDNLLEDVSICVVYKNYRGETASRKIIPLRLYFGKTEYHPEKQWLLHLWDLDRRDYRTYALKDIISWDFK